MSCYRLQKAGLFLPSPELASSTQAACGHVKFLAAKKGHSLCPTNDHASHQALCALPKHLLQGLIAAVRVRQLLTRYGLEVLARDAVRGDATRHRCVHLRE